MRTHHDIAGAMAKPATAGSWRTALMIGLSAAALAGCSSGGGDDPAATPQPDTPDNPTTTTTAFQELYDQGVDRYLGVFAPMAVDFLPGNIRTYSFDGSAGGPLCFTGNPYTMSTRDGSGSELMIFLQGGGLCSADNCDAVDEAPPGIPAFGILDASEPTNPAASYNVSYVPYCDGSLFMGDRDTDSDGDGTNDRLFRGVQNLSAALDVIVSNYPAPSKILVIGNSAGGFGTHSALPLVRKLYPGVRIELVNDSGVGIQPPDSQEALNAYWNSGAFFPASCPECIGDDGNLTDYHAYQIAEDPDLRMGIMSTKQDAVVTTERGALSPEVFEAELLEAMAELRASFPDRFRSFIADGDGHTFVLRDFDRAVGGTTVRQWIADLLDGGEGWVSVGD